MVCEKHWAEWKKKRFLKLAEKIADGILQSKLVKNTSNSMITFKLVTRLELTEAISKVIFENLTYGNLGTLSLRNNLGQIVAKLYIMPDGTLADDSWLCNLGWNAKKPYKKGCPACEEAMRKRNAEAEYPTP